MLRNILIIDDETFFNKNLAKNLAEEGYEARSEFNGKDGLDAAHDFQPDVVIIDLKLPDIDGIEVLKKIKDYHDAAICILITAHGYVEAAVSAMRLGAYDFIEKPFPADKLKVVIKNALEAKELMKTVEVTTKREGSKFGLESLIGSSEPILEVSAMLNKIIKNEARMVLLTGETGTGKGLVAKIIHYNGPRNDKPFIEMNCAAIPENLLESELFGYEAGAFTDARKSKSGIFEDAHKGTLLLDEIGDMSMNLQAKLVKVIEERTFRRLGGKKDIKVDVNIIAATNKNLTDEVQEGRFREDLYHRLNVIKFEMPALRIRRDDIKILTDYFIGSFNAELNKKVSVVSDEIRRKLANYNWPGNVRELKATIERAMILSEGDELNPKYVQLDDENNEIKIQSDDKKMNLEISLEDASLEKIEELIIRQSLEHNDWNQTRTADMLGMNRQNLRYRMKKMGLLN